MSLLQSFCYREFAKGPPGQAPTVIPYHRGKNVIEDLVESGQEFVMGPPVNPKKLANGPREAVIYKMEPRIDVYARKLRELYVRRSTITQVKSFVNPERMRLPTDTIKYCLANGLVAGCIEGREEFEDVDLTWRSKVASRITRNDHPFMRPYYVTHPETEEEIRVTCKSIEYHPTIKKAYNMKF